MNRFVPRYATLVLTLSALGLSGCASMSKQVRTRFVNEYECADRDVTIKDLGGNSYQARGCGHQVSYTCVRPNEFQVTCVRD